jgi:hypothetical protein
MTPSLRAILAFAAGLFKTRLSMQVDILALRHQLAVYQRSGGRPKIQPADRLLWSWLSRMWIDWKEALCLRETKYRDRLAAHGKADNRMGCDQADPKNVHGQSSLGLAEDYRRTQQDRN